MISLRSQTITMTRGNVMGEPINPDITPAVLGWSNPTTNGGANLRLYALDKGPSPRWDKDGGRTIEMALIERDGGRLYEGDRYLVVHLGDRFISEAFQNIVIKAINKELSVDYASKIIPD